MTGLGNRCKRVFFYRYVNSAKVSNNVNYNGANPGGNKTEGGSNILIGFGAESTIPSELFTIMKENSFFLLELNSYNGGRFIVWLRLQSLDVDKDCFSF